MSNRSHSPQNIDEDYHRDDRSINRHSSHLSNEHYSSHGHNNNDSSHGDQIVQNQSTDRQVLTGSVKWYNYSRGFGFVSIDKSTLRTIPGGNGPLQEKTVDPTETGIPNDAYIHGSDVLGEKFLRDNDEISFELALDAKNGKNLKAVNITGASATKQDVLAKFPHLDLDTRTGLPVPGSSMKGKGKGYGKNDRGFRSERGNYGGGRYDDRSPVPYGGKGHGRGAAPPPRSRDYRRRDSRGRSNSRPRRDERRRSRSRSVEEDRRKSRKYRNDDTPARRRSRSGERRTRY